MAFLRELLSRLEPARKARPTNRRREAALTEAIRRVAQLSAPVVCTLRDCRRELRSPVEHALGYIEQAIDAIPGPVPLAPERWGQDPLLQALFVNPDEIQTLLAGNRRLRTFFAQRPAERAFALLVATKKERTVFATAVEGGLVQRDVAQTAVEFHDHRIVDPCPDPVETRSALKDRALNALVTQVLERLLTLRSLKDELKEQQRVLSIQFKIQQSRLHGLDDLKPEEAAGEAALSAANPVLADIGRQIQDLSAESDSAEAYVRQLAAVLNAPQQVLTIAPIVMRLNWMGIKLAESAGADGGIRLAEVELKSRFKRMAVLVDITRQDSAAV